MNGSQVKWIVIHMYLYSNANNEGDGDILSSGITTASEQVESSLEMKVMIKNYVYAKDLLEENLFLISSNEWAKDIMIHSGLNIFNWPIFESLYIVINIEQCIPWNVCTTHALCLSRTQNDLSTLIWPCQLHSYTYVGNITI